MKGSSDICSGKWFQDFLVTGSPWAGLLAGNLVAGLPIGSDVPRMRKVFFADADTVITPESGHEMVWRGECTPHIGLPWAIQCAAGRLPDSAGAGRCRASSALNGLERA